MFDDVGSGFLDGEMTIPASKNTQNLGRPDFNTLDEPIRDTIVFTRFYIQNYIILLIFRLGICGPLESNSLMYYSLKRKRLY